MYGCDGQIAGRDVPEALQCVRHERALARRGQADQEHGMGAQGHGGLGDIKQRVVVVLHNVHLREESTVGKQTS